MDTHELPGMRGPGGLSLDGTEPSSRPDEAMDRPHAGEAGREDGEPTREVPPRQAFEALDFSVHASLRYHAKRRAWFDLLHRLALGIIVLAASGAVGALEGGLFEAGIDLTLAVAAAAALELFFGFAERARAEDALYRRLNALATAMAEADTIDEHQLRLWDRRRLLIRADCEERLLVLHRICYNLEAEARGFPEETLYDVRPWQRLAAPLVSLPPHRPRRLPPATAAPWTGGE